MTNWNKIEVKDGYLQKKCKFNVTVCTFHQRER